MDLWLTCVNSNNIFSLVEGREYQVLDINPLKGIVQVINEFDNTAWYSEKRFNKAKKEEDDVIMEKQCYGKIDLDLNVIGRQLTASVKNVDRRLPSMNSMNKFLGVKCPWDIDISIVKTPFGTAVELSGDNTVINGLYKDNTEALDYTNKARKAINYFNDILSRKEIKLKKVYNVKFSPEGKVYTFRNVHEDIEVGDTVVCRSISGNQYALVHGILEVDEKSWETRAFCKKVK